MTHGYGICSKVLLAFCGLMAFFGMALGDVVVNEVELSAPDNSPVWVELYNTGEEIVDITGWIVKIEDTPWVGIIPLSGTINPKEFIAVDGKASWETTGNGTVYIYDSTGNEMEMTPQISDDSHNDFTYGRIPDGKKTDTRADFAFVMGSKGRSNSRGVSV